MTASDDFTYKPQAVNYLGFLEAQLRDMQGIYTLAYELIQNADDAPPGVGNEQGPAHPSPITHLTFNISDDALLVSNNGVFRDLDFQRLQNIASGGKRQEAGTTGAFGLGFIAVYQVTDAPEIFSNGRHWRITPQAPAQQRIQERPAQTSETLFRLPWAFDPASVVRRSLRLDAIQPDQLDDFAQYMAAAIEPAALFLKQLQLLEVQRNGQTIRRINRKIRGEQLILQENGIETAVYHLLTGDFAATAEQLRVQYPWQIEAKRHSQVQIALPLTTPSQMGRLYASLPTSSTMPLPCHLNADFFPTTDRKRIQFDNGYQAEWNQAAIAYAAQLLAERFETLPSLLGHVNLWHLLQKMADTHQTAQTKSLPPIFTTFWQTLKPLLSQMSIIFTAKGEWRGISEVRLGGKQTAVALLDALQIPSPHPDLFPHLPLLRRLAVLDLSIADITAALAKIDLKQGQFLHEAPPYWRDLAAWQGLWQLIDTLLGYLPPRERETALQSLRPLPLILTEKMTVERLAHSYRGRTEARDLFPEVAWAHEMITPDHFPGRYLPDFGMRAAVNWLQERPLDQLEQDWRLSRLDIPRLWQWLERRQIEISDDPSLAQTILKLPLCPIEGRLRPLAHLYLPGNFADPLNLAGLIDIAALGSSRQFLRDLGVPELDFDTYVRHQLPRALQQQPDLPSDGRHQLLQLLAARLGQMRDDDDLRAQLSQLPLIACLDGSFRPANQVYASREVQTWLREGVHIAEPVDSKAVTALHHWLGVRQRPSAADIVQAMLTSPGKSSTPDTATSPGQNLTDMLQRRWQYLQELAAQGEVDTATLAPLQNQPVIPNRQGKLCGADQLFWVDRPELAAQFAGLDKFLVPEAAWTELTAVLGVRPLSAAVQLILVNAATAEPDIVTQTHIGNRRPLIERLLQAEGIKPSITFFSNLQVIQQPQPQVQYQLQAGTKLLTTSPEPVTVKLLETLLVLAEESWSWTAVARELARALKGDRASGSLALGLKEVLTAGTVAEARKILDELGIG